MTEPQGQTSAEPIEEVQVLECMKMCLKNHKTFYQLGNGWKE